MQRLQLTCEGCSKVFDLRKTNEVPAHVFFMRCNFCPCCEDYATEEWREWWDEDENDPDRPAPVPDNQLCMPFILEELLPNALNDERIATDLTAKT